ncbi:MAG: hypothetical protein ACRCXD_01520 [Luteolibacter sp.]
MIARLISIFLTCVSAAPLCAQGSAGFSPALRPAFEYGPRPPQSVFDPGGYLDPAFAKVISDPLEALFKKEGIDVVVVVLPDLGKAPPEHIAQSFGSAWCLPALHCVVMHVPGHEGSPWIFPDGKLVDHLDPAHVEKAVGDARRRAAAEAKDPDQVKAAAEEAADLLRYWMANALNRTEMIQFEKARMRQELETKSQQWKIATMVAAAGAIPLIAGVWVVFVILRRRGPGHFPTPDCRAPHAGESREVVDPEPPSR